MIETLLFSMNAVLPLVVLVFIGYMMRYKGIFTDEFIKIANRFCFRFCFFSTLFISVYNIESFNPVYRDIAVFTVCSILILILAGVLYAVFFVKDPRQKGVMAQAFYRSNYAIIGISLVSNLCGESGLAVAAIVLASTIPLFNISAVIVLTVFLRENGERVSFSSVILKILTNPLIDGIAVAFVCQFIRPYLGGWTLKNGEICFVYRTIESLAKITTPLSLIILGGQFKFSSVRHLLPKISVAVLFRLVIAPAFGLSAAHFFFPHFATAEYAALIPLFGSPVAVASAIMANQMHNDGELATQILVWSTLLSGVTIFIIIAILKMLGIF
ncbi:MAG: AEC family transporter [Treponema sp.]|nr:AEC family transporter [Treponema sp.]